MEAGADGIHLLLVQLLWGFSTDVSKMRAKFITTLPRGGSNHTVLFTDVPGINKGTMLGRSTIASAVGSKVPVMTKVASTLKTAKDVVQSTVQVRKGSAYAWQYGPFVWTHAYMSMLQLMLTAERHTGQCPAAAKSRLDVLTN